MRVLVVIGIALVAALAVILLSAPPVRADSTVGTGNASSCTSQALANAIAAGSGNISFACGAAPATIVITQPGGLVIPGGVQITLDGANQIELSGGLAWRVFVVSGGASLTLKNLSVVKGYSPSDDGGAIYNGGTLNIYGCLFAGNQTSDPWSGGAIVTYGPLNVGNSEFRQNQAGNGGAIYPRFSPAVTVITGTTFDDNITTNSVNGWGGALLLWDGAPVTLIQDDFHDNIATGDGGAIYVEGPSSLTISATQYYSNAASNQGGGALYSQGTLSVTDSTLVANHAFVHGGAIQMASGSTSILRSLLAQNWAGYGGAVDQEAGTLFIADSWFSGNGYGQNGNPVTVDGGAVDSNGGLAVLNNVTLSSNYGSVGGGFIQTNNSTAMLQNVTVSDNQATFGAGIYNYQSTLTMTQVTDYQNSATSATGGIEVAGNTWIWNSIVANNDGGDCGGGTFASSAFNLASDGTCVFGPGRGSVSIQLMSLRNNGGFAPTHLPWASSPAVDNASLLYCPSTDQRGVIRPQGAACDVGAVERIPGELAPVLFVPLARR